MLLELAQSKRIDTADLRRTLDLDSGCLSRLLAKLDAARQGAFKSSGN